MTTSAELIESVINVRARRVLVTPPGCGRLSGVDVESVTRACAYCKTEFTPRNANHKMCKQSCSVRAYQKRKAANPTQRRCLSCRDTLPIASYAPGALTCTACNEWRITGVKVCRLCKEGLPLTAFYFRAKENAYSARCKHCISKQQMRWYSDPANKMHHRERRLLYKYGLTNERFNELLEAQGGVCAICKIAPDPDGPPFHVDHDHQCCPSDTTCGRCVRGIVCTRCNSALGYVGDSIATAQSLIDYLRSRSESSK